MRPQEKDQIMGGQDDTGSAYGDVSCLMFNMSILPSLILQNDLTARVGAIESKLDNLTNMMTT